MTHPVQPDLSMKLTELSAEIYRIIPNQPMVMLVMDDNGNFLRITNMPFETANQFVLAYAGAVADGSFQPIDKPQYNT
jgi:hypothetical protein